MEAALTLFILTGFLGALTFIFIVGRQFSRPMQFDCPRIGNHTIPLRRRNFLFSGAERSLYKVLQTMLPDHMIFVKVRLADLVPIKRADPSFWDYFSPINHRQVDFIVCDQTLAPVLAIDLEHSPQKKQRHGDDDLVHSVLASASLPMVRIPEQRRYILEELSRLLAPYLRVSAPMI